MPTSQQMQLKLIQLHCWHNYLLLLLVNNQWTINNVFISMYLYPWHTIDHFLFICSLCCLILHGDITPYSSFCPFIRTRQCTDYMQTIHSWSIHKESRHPITICQQHQQQYTQVITDMMQLAQLSVTLKYSNTWESVTQLRCTNIGSFIKLTSTW